MTYCSYLKFFSLLTLFLSVQALADPALQRLQALETAAIDGDVLAQTELASRYYLGEGVEKNLSQAVAWYQLAAKNGDMNAQYSLANLYLLGEGIAADPQTASHWYQMAANQGHEQAAQRLKQLPSHAKPTIADSSNNQPPTNTSSAELEASESSEKAAPATQTVAETNSTNANSDLFDQLFGTTQASPQANPQPSPTTKTAEPTPDTKESDVNNVEEQKIQQIPTSKQTQPAKNTVVTTKQEPTDTKPTEFRPNSDLQPGPIVNQQAEPEVVYEKITEENPELFRLYQRAREGDPKAQYSIGNAFYQGHGVKQNHQQAFLWFRRAADSGNANAQYALGNIYFMGEGVPQSDDQAYYWYEKASLSGHKKATHNLYNLKKLTGRTQPPDLTLDTNIKKN